MFFLFSYVLTCFFCFFGPVFFSRPFLFIISHSFSLPFFLAFCFLFSFIFSRFCFFPQFYLIVVVPLFFSYLSSLPNFFCFLSLHYVLLSLVSPVFSSVCSLPLFSFICCISLTLLLFLSYFLLFLITPLFSCFLSLHYFLLFLFFS